MALQKNTKNVKKEKNSKGFSFQKRPHLQVLHNILTWSECKRERSQDYKHDALSTAVASSSNH